MKSYKGQAMWAWFLVVLHEIGCVGKQGDWMWIHITAVVVVLINMALIWWDRD